MAIGNFFFFELVLISYLFSCSCSSGFRNILDNTRVHPNHYDVAKQICLDALEIQEEDIDMHMRQVLNTCYY